MAIASYVSLVISVLGICSVVQAQHVNHSSWLPDAIFAQSAVGEHTRSFTSGLQWRWHRIVRISGSTHVSGYLETTIGRWRVQTEFDSNAHRWTNQLSVVPTLRLTATPLHGWYADAGVGPSYLTPKFHNKDKSFLTRFQFRSHVGVGYQWGVNVRQDHHNDIAIRVEHFSNAGYAAPNPGVNLFAVRYTYIF
jgi:lipid A 3-O-deacylase